MKKLIIKNLDKTVYVFDESLSVFGHGVKLREAFDDFEKNMATHSELINKLELETQTQQVINEQDLGSTRKSIRGRILDGACFSIGLSVTFGVLLGGLVLVLGPIVTKQAKNMIHDSEFVLKSAFYDSLDGGDSPRCYRCVVQAVLRSIAQDLENATPEEKKQLEKDIATISEYYQGDVID